MRLNINLATQPFEDAGRIYRTWGPLTAVAGLITVVLLGLAGSSLLSARTVGKQTSELRRQMAEFDRQKRAAEQLLGRPENRDTRDRSRFLNALIARKTFSWTQVFADLEKIIPARVHVQDIEPRLTDDNRIQVQMRIVTDSREKSVEMVRRMEESKTFQQTQVKTETAQNAGTGGSGVQFEIVAYYVPHEPSAVTEDPAGPKEEAP